MTGLLDESLRERGEKIGTFWQRIGTGAMRAQAGQILQIAVTLYIAIS
jgi:hypothetical protein